MGLVTLIFKAPFLPIRGVVAIGELIRDQAEREISSPSSIRAEMEELDRERETGLMSDAEVAEAERRAIDRLMGGR